MLDGTLTKAQLGRLRGISVGYGCPWYRKAKVKGFTFALANIDNEVLEYQLQGDRIPAKYLRQIAAMDQPTYLYIFAIDWIPIGCGESINSMLLEIN